MESIEQLSNELGVRLNDLIGFISIIDSYMDNGVELQAAIRLIQQNSAAMLVCAVGLSEHDEFLNAMTNAAMCKRRDRVIQ